MLPLIDVYREEHHYQSSARSVISGLGNLRTWDWRDSVVSAQETGGTQSFQPPRYPRDWRDSVLSSQVPLGLAELGPLSSQAPWGLAELSHFRPPCTLRTGEIVLSAPQVPLELAGLSPFSLPGTVGTGRSQSFQPPRYPGDWRYSVLSTSQVPLGTGGGTQSFQHPRYPGD